MIKTVLIDRRNIADELPKAFAAVAAAPFVGLDCETEDSGRHDGLNKYCKYKEDGSKAKNTKLVFDTRRTVMCGFSIWPEGSDTAWYVNLGHKDVQNRVEFSEVQSLLDGLPDGASFICHNAPFELVMFENCVGYKLPEGRVICSLQLAVSAYGPDEYQVDTWRAAGLGAMRNKLGALQTAARKWTPKDDRDRNFPSELADAMASITGKASKAAHSYNGFVDSVCYGYGLKKAVKTWLGHDMTTFDEVLGDNVHMGQLTGEDTVAYGAEDAIYCVKLFRKLLTWMAVNSPAAIGAFFTQENPMIHVYAEIWRDGIVIHVPDVVRKRDEERQHFVDILRQLKATVRKMLPFSDNLNPELAEMEAWYAKNGARYRARIEAWATSKDDDDPFTEAVKISGAVPNAWAEELGVETGDRLNIGHYMPARVLFYDLLGAKILRSEGKVQSDGDARAKLIVKLEKEEGKENAVEFLKLMGQLTSIEQTMKLYLTPYLWLLDPETGRIYPVISSMLATRRMAAAFPNTTQLSKAGDSSYVRGFYRADADDQLILSVDWSGIELVRIGEESQDPEFIKAYGQLPHADLHAGATADLLAIDIPGMTEAIFKMLRNAKTYEDIPFGHARLLMDLDGRPIDPSKAYSYWRRELGKVANFNYWYSGWLATIGESMGWTMKELSDAVNRYATRFAVAEAWRKGVIEKGAFEGYADICDGHRRVRPEARLRFLDEWMAKWPIDRHSDPVFYGVIQEMGRRLHRRAGNQLVNAKIQGGCAAVAKRSILSIREAFKKEGIDNRVCRFMWPTHDELTFSVRWDMAIDMLEIIRPIMCDHPELFQHVVLDASASLGVTFEPWNHKKARAGQVELMEAPDIAPVPKEKIGGLLNTVQMKDVARWLHEEARSAA